MFPCFLSFAQTNPFDWLLTASTQVHHVPIPQVPSTKARECPFQWSMWRSCSAFQRRCGLTRLLRIFIHDNQVARSSPGRPPQGPPRYFSHFESTSFGPLMEFRPWKDPNELVAKLIGRMRRFGRCGNEDLWWYCRQDCRIVGRGKVGSKRVRRDVRC